MGIKDVLVKIQAELKAPKNQVNSFGHYNYRNCEDILEAVKPLLKTTNSTLVISDEIVLIGARYYVKATATLTNGSEQAFATAYAREEEDKKGMDKAQITGAASSYARKYALNGLFAIDDTKDADSNNKGEEVKPETHKPEEHKTEPIKPQDQRSAPKPNVALTVNQSLTKKIGETFNVLAVVHDTEERTTSKGVLTDYKVSDSGSNVKSIISKFDKTMEGLKSGDIVLFKGVKVGMYQNKLTYLAHEIEKVGK